MEELTRFVAPSAISGNSKQLLAIRSEIFISSIGGFVLFYILARIERDIRRKFGHKKE
jgi:hypothetical protein